MNAVTKTGVGRPKTPDVRQKAIDLYLSGMTAQETGTVVGAGRETVHSWLRADGIPRREPNDYRLTGLQLFFSHIQFDPNSGCWLFSGSHDAEGYGLINIAGKAGIRAHRASWAHHFGEIPNGLKVCHRCDVRCCVNPDHLFLGTQQDNIADMVAKGRQRGIVRQEHDYPTAKLTVEDVLEIRALVAAGAVQRHLCARFGVSPMTISRAVRGESWRRL